VKSTRNRPSEFEVLTKPFPGHYRATTGPSSRSHQAMPTKRQPPPPPSPRAADRAKASVYAKAMAEQVAPVLQVREPSVRYGPAHVSEVLVDSGPLIALFNAGDRWHAPVLAWLKANPATALLSTWPVATEVCALLARRIHNARLKLRHVLSIDADFDVYRDRAGRPLVNLLAA
jgi:hypothetical protein